MEGLPDSSTSRPSAGAVCSGRGPRGSQQHAALLRNVVSTACRIVKEYCMHRVASRPLCWMVCFGVGGVGLAPGTGVAATEGSNRVPTRSTSGGPSWVKSG